MSDEMIKPDKPEFFPSFDSRRMVLPRDMPIAISESVTMTISEVATLRAENEAEKAAEEYANSYGHGPYIPPRFLEDVRDLLRDELKLAHLAGQHAGRKRMIDEAKEVRKDYVCNFRIIQGAIEYTKDGKGCVLISDLEKLEEK